MPAGQDRDGPIAATATQAADCLLPQPRLVQPLDGFFRLADGVVICHGGSLGPPDPARGSPKAARGHLHEVTTVFRRLAQQARVAAGQRSKT